MARKKKESKPYHHGDLRRALIDAAAEMLETETPIEVSLRKASEHVGVSHTAAYRHFLDKAELLAAVSEAGFLRLRDNLAEARAAAGADYRLQLEAIAKEYIRFAVTKPSTYRQMFGPHFQEQLKKAGVAESASNAFAELLHTVMAGQKAGVIRKESPFLISQTAWSLLHGMALFYIDGELQEMTEGTIADRCFGFLWDGIGAAR